MPRDLTFRIIAENQASPALDEVTQSIQTLSTEFDTNNQTLALLATSLDSLQTQWATFSTQLTELLPAISSSLDTFQNSWTTTFEALDTSLSNSLLQLQTYAEAVDKQLENLARSIASHAENFYQGGANLIDQLWLGMAANWTNLEIWLTNRLLEVESWLKGSSPPIAGPWSDMDTWTRSFWPTVQTGIEDGFPDFQDRLRSLMQSAKTEISINTNTSRTDLLSSQTAPSTTPARTAPNITINGGIIDGFSLRRNLRSISRILRDSTNRDTILRR